MAHEDDLNRLRSENDRLREGMRRRDDEERAEVKNDIRELSNAMKESHATIMAHITATCAPKAQCDDHEGRLRKLEGRQWIKHAFAVVGGFITGKGT